LVGLVKKSGVVGVGVICVCVRGSNMDAKMGERVSKDENFV
jgi:hypothetical protein